MIVFGGCSVLNDLQAINLPAKLEEKMIPLESKTAESKENSSDTLTSKQDTVQLAKRKAEKREKMEKARQALPIPETTKLWIVRFGYIGFFISIIYTLAGVFLLIPKKFSIKLAYGALVLSIAFSAVKTIVLTSSGSSSGVIALTMGATQLFGIILDIILLSVIFSAENKEGFTN